MVRCLCALAERAMAERRLGFPNLDQSISSRRRHARRRKRTARFGATFVNFTVRRGAIPCDFRHLYISEKWQAGRMATLTLVTFTPGGSLSRRSNGNPDLRHL